MREGVLDKSLCILFRREFLRLLYCLLMCWMNSSACSLSRDIGSIRRCGWMAGNMYIYLSSERVRGEYLS